jgi:hypothetical protein
MLYSKDGMHITDLKNLLAKLIQNLHSFFL